MYQMAHYCKNIRYFLSFYEIRLKQKENFSKTEELIVFDRVYNIFCNTITYRFLDC